MDQQSIVQQSIDGPSPYVGDNSLYDFDSMSQVEALVVTTETIATETIVG